MRWWKQSLACLFAFSIAISLILCSRCLAQADSAKPLRVGIIGLDTSHVIEFTRIFNDASDPEHVPGVQVVAAFKGGSPDVADSWSRVDKFTQELQDKWKIQIVSDIPTLCSMVDAVLLESVDGRKHLEQVKPVFAAHKPVFIDKPLAASYRDAKEIDRLAQEAGVPWFSSSSLRYWDDLQNAKTSPDIGGIIGCSVYGPCEIEPHHPDLMWYGVHAVEMLYTLMGTGCDTVTRVHTGDTDVVVGKWKDGRVGVMRGTRNQPYAFGMTVFGAKGVVCKAEDHASYRPLLVEVAKFFRTHVPPFSHEETLEIFAFMEAADLSKARGGVPVSLSDVMK
jgi:predicted dehydrogenase